ncbi:SsrA-binding protein [Candidatus Desantisbacteria bacterium CG1_02_38_46]|uniref:SsrA-binding protein n=1 Tax=Candidatus Desantisbacteria bacterium CG1_02_38_46 TaxID=1817893 RepID=A0A1J4SBE6_9BACT|nr:MAG: SsrA-binding protein [Candidatus Desantisbacteria bacterium CG1_02_38_46]
MAEKIIAVNRKAYHNYFILETYESGLVLTGGEVKSLREGKVNLGDSFGRIEKNEAFLYNMHISPYFYDAKEEYDPLRTRKLLFHREEINRLIGKINQKGLTLIPLKLYFKKGRAKIELGLAKGKKLHDKREVLKKKADKREIDRAMRGRG